MKLTAQIEGINLERLLRCAQEENILLTHAYRCGDRAMRVCLRMKDRKKLEALCARSGWQMRETGANLPLRMFRFICARLFLAAGLVVCVLMVWLSSHVILRVEVEHAQQNIAEVRRFLREEGVRPGRLKASFSLDDLRSKLALRLPGLSFAALRYEGSTLIVDGRPAVMGEEWMLSGSGQDIVAAMPGIITKVFASSGTPQVVPGQAVHHGQILIKGEERTEKGGLRPVMAQGEVMARVFAGGQAKVSLQEKRTVETGQSRTRVTVKTPWHERVVRDAQPFDSQDVSRDVQTVVGLYLPLWREKETYAQTTVFESQRNRGDAASMAQGAAEEIAKKECPYGALILDKWVDYSMIDNEYLYATVVLEYETSIAGRTK